MSNRVFITGGTGFLGKALVNALRGRGDTVVVLTRNPDRAREVLGNQVELIAGDPALGGTWQHQLSQVDVVVNLAGESVAGQRWDARFKQILRDSRVETTRYIVESLAALKPGSRPTVLVSASGIDYYPSAVDLGAALPVDEDDEVTETAPPGSSFLARMCQNWEAEALAAQELGVRVVCMRTGLVLGHGGALDRMAQPFRMFVGGRLGNGRQWFSWIHLDDATRAYLVAIDQDTIRGALNLVAPQPVRAGAFAQMLGKALGRPAWLPVPGFAIKAAVGEFAEYLLNGRRAVPAALAAHGFEFRFADVESALADIYGLGSRK